MNTTRANRRNAGDVKRIEHGERKGTEQIANPANGCRLFRRVDLETFLTKIANSQQPKQKAKQASKSSARAPEKPMGRHTFLSPKRAAQT